MPNLIYPEEMTLELEAALQILNFQSGPIAHLMRDSGKHQIAKKCESEQAYVLHWMIKLCLQHGKEWPKIASAYLEEIRPLAEANRGAAEKATGRPVSRLDPDPIAEVSA